MNRHRCACKPSCLSPLQPTDKTTLTPDGLALATHLWPTHIPRVDGLTSLTSPLSERGGHGG